MRIRISMGGSGWDGVEVTQLPQGTGGTWNGPASITNEGTWIYVQTASGSPGGENGWVLLRENRMGWAK